MIRLRRPPEQSHRLDPAFRPATDPKDPDRLPIVRRARRDRPHQDRAAERAVAPRTGPRGRHASRERGGDGRRPRQAQGAPGTIPANWTPEGLADHLLKAQGIPTRRPAVGRFCRQLGIRLDRPSYPYERGDPDQQAPARQDLAARKKTTSANSAGC